MDVAACPKCGTARDEARTHCKSCGLANAKMSAFEKARDDVPEALTAAWQTVVDNWDEPARHDALLRLVTQHDAYAWAAARYRERNDDIAKEQIERVRKAAEVTLLSSAAQRKANVPEPYRNTMAMLALLILLIVAGLVYAFARGSGSGIQRERFDQPPPPSEVR